MVTKDFVTNGNGDKAFVLQTGTIEVLGFASCLSDSSSKKNSKKISQIFLLNQNFDSEFFFNFLFSILEFFLKLFFSHLLQFQFLSVRLPYLLKSVDRTKIEHFYWSVSRPRH